MIQRMRPKSAPARERLLQSAIRLFHAKGYNATSVQNIVDKARLPKGTFYNHYKSKESLALEVLRVYNGRIRAAFSKETTLTPLERLRNHFECLAQAYAAQGFKNGCMLGNFAAEVGSTPRLGKAVAAHLESWTSDISNLIREAQVLGELEEGLDKEAVASHLADSFQGATLRLKLIKSPAPVDNFMRITFDKILAPSSKFENVPTEK